MQSHRQDCAYRAQSFISALQRQVKCASKFEVQCTLEQAFHWLHSHQQSLLVHLIPQWGRKYQLCLSNIKFFSQVLLCFEKTLIARIQRVTAQSCTQTKHVSSLSQWLLLCYLHIQFPWSRNLPLSVPYWLISGYNALDQAETFYLSSCWGKTFFWATAEDTYHLLLLL